MCSSSEPLRSGVSSPPAPDSNVPQARAAGTWVTSDGAGIKLVTTFLHCDPDSVRAWRTVSRAFRWIGEDVLQHHAERILSLCSFNSSPLFSLIARNHVRPLSSPPVPTGILFHIGVSEGIRALGVSAEGCPDHVLSADEISRFNEQTQRIQDVNLKKAWSGIRKTVSWKARPPQEEASVQEIRLWMQEHQSILQGITQLSLKYLELRSVPTELRLLTKLRALDLSGNLLACLPDDLFHGMPGLEALSLANNALTSLPESLFRGLTSLKILMLKNNRLITLPENLFQGLAALDRLTLEHNRLNSLPQRLFGGLTSLQSLALDNNHLHSIPAGLFQGLNRLKALHLDDNRLLFLPAELFCGLGEMQKLYLFNNQLTALPQGLFHGLVHLDELYLHGNPQLLFFLENQTRHQNGILLPQLMDLFFNYRCVSSLAYLYQIVSGGSSSERIKKAFEELPETIKNDLSRRIWEEAGRPSLWEPQFVFINMHIFAKALKGHVRERFESLTPEQEVALYQLLANWTSSEREAEDIDALQWARLHAFDNIPRLIDAIHQCSTLSR